MIRKIIHKLFLSALLPLVLLFIACSEKDLITDDNNGNQGQEAVVTQTDIYFNITIAVPSALNSDTRIENSTLSDLRGNPVNETALNNVTLFVVDYDPATNIDDWTDCAYSTLPVYDSSINHDEDSGESTVDLQFDLTVSRGSKHVYAAANLSDELIEQCAATGVFHAPATVSSDDYYSVVSRFIDSSNGAVAMFGTDVTTILVNDNAESRIDNVMGSRENPYTGTYRLECMLSKVLLACDMVDGDDSHVAVQANVPAVYKENYNGWMRLSSVRFKLGTTNRTTYFFKHLSDDGSQVVDPNYCVADQLAVKSGGGWTYADGYDNDFTYSETLGSDFLPKYSDTQQNATKLSINCMNAVKYDPSLMPGSSSDTHYTAGLYCLENTLDNNWSALPDYDGLLSTRLNWFVGPRLIATTLNIESQYIPAVIVGEGCIERNSSYKSSTSTSIAQRLAEMFEFNPYCFGDASLPLHRQPDGYAGDAEDAARSYIIAESADPEAAIPTYYALQIGDAYYFFTYRGACELIKLAQSVGLGDYFGSNMSPFITYKDGLAYYYTYLNRITDQNPDQAISGIERNRYYVVRCTYLTVPSAVNTLASPTTYSRSIIE